MAIRSRSLLRLSPALLLAYLIMIVAWPWAALAPLNPIRGLLSFSQFHYEIRTLLAGRVYTMADVPRLYVPIYILIRVPLITLFGAALGMLLALLPRRADGPAPTRQKDIVLVSLTAIFPVACQVICDGPAFTGLRHFTFVDSVTGGPRGHRARRCANGARDALSRGLFGAFVGLMACFAWNAVTLVMLHPYEYLFYNPLVGGLKGASRHYDLDYWFDSMPEVSSPARKLSSAN